MKTAFLQKPLVQRATLVLLAVVFTVGVLLVSGAGQSIAQKLFQFFKVTEAASFPLPTDQQFLVPNTPTPAPMVILPLEPATIHVQPAATQPVDTTCSTPALQQEYFCQIKAMEAQAGFDLKEFEYDPKGTKFSTVTYDKETGRVSMEFLVTTGGGYLYLRQGVKEYVPADNPWSTVPSGAVAQVSVNGNYAEMAMGTYVVYPDATEAVWEPGGMLSLVWREGNRWFVLEKMGDPYPIEWITREEMVRLAESLVDQRPMDSVPPLDPENLKTVAAAEELAGYDVLEPTLLPKGYEFKRAVWTGSSVLLFYGPEGSSGSTLMISIVPVDQVEAGPCNGCPPGTVETVQVGQGQGWYWRGIFFTEMEVEGQPTPTPVWQADAMNWVLVWQAGDLWIGINFAPGDNGEEMNKETLIAIAESMR